MSEFDFGSSHHFPDVRKPAASLRWHHVWIAAVTQPSTNTFYALLDDPRARVGRALVWVALAGAVSFALPFLFDLTLMEAIIGAALGSLMSVLWHIVGGCMMQFAAKLNGGHGTYADYLYATGTFVAPLLLINALIIPFATTQSLTLSLLTLFLLGYQLVLTAMSLRAVNDFAWERVIGTMVLNIILWVGLVIVLLVGLGLVL